VGFDWISFSVDLAAVAREQGVPFDGATAAAIGTDAAIASQYAAHLFAFFFGGVGLDLAEVKGAGRWYSFRAPIINAAGEFVGMIELGGERAQRKDGTHTARLELTGAGCQAFNAGSIGHAKRWLMLRAQLEATQGRITRVDVCADDLEGRYPLKLAQAWYTAGDFKKRGQQPKAKLIDDYDSGDGKSFYVGSEASESVLRVYEKGREQGDPTSPWVRYEAQFRASSRREIPLDVLRDPGAYFLGVYPVLRFIQAVAERMEVVQAQAAASWKAVRRHLSRQYGAVLNFVATACRSDEAIGSVVRGIASDKQPKWVAKLAGVPGLNWPDIVSANQHAPGGVFSYEPDALLEPL
jgi:DNA relaxase NicK